jgi:hypothetical protein
MKKRTKIDYLMFGILLTFGLVLAVGCGGKAAMSIEKISNAERAISDARESNAIVHAPLDLKLAEDKLAAAKETGAREEYIAANRLADEAILDADYARARSRAFKAEQILKEMRSSIDALRKEIESTSKAQ